MHQRVWVIGASSGIGEACARELLKRGAKLVLSSRRIERLEDIARSADTTQSLVIPVDVMDQSSITRAYQTIHTQWGGVDLLLFVSGIYIPLRADDFNMEDAQKQWTPIFWGQCEQLLPSFQICCELDMVILQLSAVLQAIAAYLKP